METIEADIQRNWEGLVTGTPDPLSCIGNRTNLNTETFDRGNARVFDYVNDAITWCSSSPSSSSSGEQTSPAGHIQILVTGSLYLVANAMTVLGCKVEDI